MKNYETKVCGPDTICGVFKCGCVLIMPEDMCVFRRKNVGLNPLEWEYEIPPKQNIDVEAEADDFLNG
jgi:hypothetical protein